MTTAEKIMGAGKVLYMINTPNNEIARLLDVSETTVSNWVTKGGWREERAAGLAMKRTMSDNVLFLIDYQMEALKELTEQYRAAGKLKLLDKGEIDALSKLFAAIKGKELTFANVVTFTRELVEFLNQKNPDIAKVVIPYTSDFLLAKKEVMV